VGRPQNKLFIVTLSNGKTLRIVSKDAPRALARARKWCEFIGEKDEPGIKPVSQVEVL
jgi:hypothetical protein